MLPLFYKVFVNIFFIFRTTCLHFLELSFFPTFQWRFVGSRKKAILKRNVSDEPDKHINKHNNQRTNKQETWADWTLNCSICRVHYSLSLFTKPLRKYFFKDKLKLVKINKSIQHLISLARRHALVTPFATFCHTSKRYAIINEEIEGINLKTLTSKRRQNQNWESCLVKWS